MKVSTVLLICTFSVSAFAAVDTNELKTLLHEWRWNPKDVDPSSFTQEQKDWMISELRERGDMSNVTEQWTTQRLLIELGDHGTAEKVVAEYLAEDASRQQITVARKTLESVTQPWVIPMLAPALLRDEPLERRYWEYGDSSLPRSAGSANIIWQIGWRSPSFSAEVRESARRMGYILNMEIVRDAVRQWWLENKEHFEKQDYAAVKPLDFEAARKQVTEGFKKQDSTALPKEPTVATVPPPPPPPPPKAVSPPSTVATAPKAAAEKSSFPMLKVLIAALGIAAAVILLWLLAKQRRSRS
jgi:hypothetical protein